MKQILRMHKLEALIMFFVFVSLVIVVTLWLWYSYKTQQLQNEIYLVE